jgi:hypothetical protein
MYRRLFSIFSLVIVAPLIAASQGAATTPVTTPTSAASLSPTGQMLLPLLDDDPAPLLGLGLSEALEKFGSPVSVHPVRGGEAWQDDVAFMYSSGYTLFWFGDRLWQLRFAPSYQGSIYGLFLGDKTDKIYSTLGTPYERNGANLVYRLPYRGYPVRLRLVLADDTLADAYLYRADF